MTSQETRDKVLVWHKRGYSATEAARQLGLPLEEVRAIIREGDGRPKPPRKVEFIEPPYRWAHRRHELPAYRPNDGRRAVTSQETRDKVLVWHKRGYSATEAARQLGLPLEEVRAIIREGDGRPKPPRKVEFIEPPLFEQ